MADGNGSGRSPEDIALIQVLAAAGLLMDVASVFGERAELAPPPSVANWLALVMTRTAIRRAQRWRP